MESIEQLERRLARLKAEEEVRRDFKNRDNKRAQLQSEIRRRENPKLYGFISNVKSGSKKVGSYVQKQMNQPKRKIKRTYSPAFKIDSPFGKNGGMKPFRF